MYFPYLRGRQYELIAIRELVEKKILSNQIVPIIEPVRDSPTLNSTILAFQKEKMKLSYILNPKVGKFNLDYEKTDAEDKKKTLVSQLNNENMLKALFVDSDIEDNIKTYKSMNLDLSQIIAIFLNRDDINCVENKFFTDTLYNVVPFDPSFRRVRGNRILISDGFPKKNRNTDYATQDDNFFSDSHLYYKDDGYVGFSDYSVVGSDYQETGFAPYAVALHIVYFDELDRSLRIHHFVSDSNEDITDPASKFGEAVDKLVRWNKKMNLDTFGIRTFEDMHKSGIYPGLGVAKKLAIMHHLEIMGKFLDSNHHDIL